MLASKKQKFIENPWVRSGDSTTVKMPRCHRERRGPHGNWKVIRAILYFCHFHRRWPLPFLSTHLLCSTLSTDRLLIFLQKASTASQTWEPHLARLMASVTVSQFRFPGERSSRAWTVSLNHSCPLLSSPMASTC